MPRCQARRFPSQLHRAGPIAPEGACPLKNLLDQIGAAYRRRASRSRHPLLSARIEFARIDAGIASDQFAGPYVASMGLSYPELGQPQQAISILQSALPAWMALRNGLSGAALVLTDRGPLSHEVGHIAGSDYLQRAWPSMMIRRLPGSEHGWAGEHIGPVGRVC